MTKEIYLSRSEIIKFRKEGWEIVVKEVWASPTDEDKAIFRVDITLPDDQHDRMLSMLEPLVPEWDGQE